MLSKASKSVTGLVPIAGASTPEQVADIVAATELRLPPEILSELKAISQIKFGEPYEHNTFHQDMTDGGIIITLFRR